MTDTTATHRNAGTSRTPGSRLFASVPVLFLVPASLGIFLIAGPLLGLFLNIPWGQLGSIFTVFFVDFRCGCLLYTSPSPRD